MSMKKEVELFKQRQAIVNKMMDIALTVSAGDEIEVIEEKERQIKELQAQLDNMPTINDDVPAPGRPAIGVGRAVKITMPESDWAKIQEQIDNGHASSVADYFRQLHQAQWNPYVRQFGENWSLDGGHPFSSGKEQ
ncbi:hypothetical protein D3C77_204950 [compost metagenome]